MQLSASPMGQYVPIDSPVHRLDPRAKLFMLVLLVSAVFVSDDPLSLGLCTLAFFGAMALVPPILTGGAAFLPSHPVPGESNFRKRGTYKAESQWYEVARE